MILSCLLVNSLGEDDVSSATVLFDLLVVFLNKRYKYKPYRAVLSNLSALTFRIWRSCSPAKLAHISKINMKKEISN